MARLDDKTWIGGIPVDGLTAREWSDRMITDWERKKTGRVPPKVVTTVNGQVVSLFAEDAAYRDAVLASDYVAADGMSVVFASRLVTGTPLPERVATTDWFHHAAKAASRRGMKFFLLGATPEENARAAERVRGLYPFLDLCGARHGYFDDDETGEIADAVATSGADVLWIGVGNPRQLLLAHRFKELVPRLTWVRTCGGLFDFLSGLHSRAPAAVQAAGMEWAYRVALEPRRLAWRYATTNVRAIAEIAKSARESVPEARRAMH